MMSFYDRFQEPGSTFEDRRRDRTHILEDVDDGAAELQQCKALGKAMDAVMPVINPDIPDDLNLLIGDVPGDEDVSELDGDRFNSDFDG